MPPLPPLGLLRVYVHPTANTETTASQSPAFSIFGQQSAFSVWLEAMVEITNQTSDFQISLQAEVSGGTGDIAVDDIELYQGVCPVSKCVFVSRLNTFIINECH